MSSSPQRNKVCLFVLCGYKGSGKDTLINTFKDFVKSSTNYDHNTRIERFAFADPLKDLCYSIFKKSSGCRDILQRKTFDDVSTKDKPIISLGNGENTTPRDLCLVISKAVRSIDNQYFIDLTISKIKESISFHKYYQRPLVIFISDCRFQEELQRLKDLEDEHCCLVVKTFWVKRFDKSNSSDPSENSICEKDCECVVLNREGTSLNELFDNFKKFL